MADIKAADVKKLRDMTGAGMMDCKKALVEANGDFDEAISILRKKGQKVAAKRADRESAEGVAVAVINDDKTKGVVFTLNCETDFVAKNEDFVNLAKKMGEVALNYDSKDDFLAAPFEGGTIADKVIEQTGVIGEKIEIGDFKSLKAPYVGAYVHANNKIASLAGLNKAFDGAEAVARDVAMQVAAMKPAVLSYKDFTPEFLEAETEARIAAIEKENIELGRLGKTLKHVPKYISKAQLPDEVIAEAKAAIEAELKEQGKPEKIWDRIVPGKLQRFIDDNTTADKELCLLDQDFIKDGKMTVSDYVKSKDADLEITGFARVALGE
jgi:elongation factor Ts